MVDPPQQVPTCYRHPDRETYVRCVRCDRPICPECMRSAAVGHQCVECVRQGSRTVPQARTAFGGRVVSESYVTWAILALNVVVFLLDLAGGNQLTSRLAMNPALVALGDQWYRLITSAFVHFGVFHILLNMWALAVVGPYLERALGHWRFAALYLLSAVGGSVLGYWIDDPSRTLTAGASGAIFGLFAAIFVVGRRLRMDTRAIAALIVLNLAITFIVPNISRSGHIGGLITGAAVALAFAYAPRASRTAVHLIALAAVLGIFVLTVIVRTNALLG